MSTDNFFTKRLQQVPAENLIMQHLQGDSVVLFQRNAR